MRFTGRARLDGIAEVVAAVKAIPVIGNGDVCTPQDAERMIEHTKCAGIMIGRGALSRPWLFRDTWSYLTTGQIPPPPTIDQIVQMMRDHFYGHLKYRNERSAVLEFRKRVSWYSKNLTPCKVMREEMRLMNSAAEFEDILRRFLDWRHERDALRNVVLEEV
jgi:tRNA-dihydrouridine synthase